MKNILISIFSGIVVFIIGLYVTKNEFDSFLEWLHPQINPLSVALITTIIVLLLSLIKTQKRNKNLLNGIIFADNGEPLLQHDDKKLKKMNQIITNIANEIKYKGLKDEYFNVIARINDGPGNFTDLDLELFLKYELIYHYMKCEIISRNHYQLTQLGRDVKNELL